MSLPPVRQPLQARSRETQRRILTAARRLFEERDFERVRVEEISKAAGLTVGAFYARFSDKEGLLRHLEDSVQEDWYELFADWTADEEEDLEGVVRGLVSRLIAIYRRHLGVMRALVQRAKGDPALRARLQKLRHRSVGDAVGWILKYRASMQHPNPEFAIEFGSLLIRSALRETILFREVTSTRELDDDLLLEELVRMFLTYVGASPKRSNPPESGEAGVS